MSETQKSKSPLLGRTVIFKRKLWTVVQVTPALSGNIVQGNMEGLFPGPAILLLERPGREDRTYAEDQEVFVLPPGYEAPDWASTPSHDPKMTCEEAQAARNAEVRRVLNRVRSAAGPQVTHGWNVGDPGDETEREGYHGLGRAEPLPENPPGYGETIGHVVLTPQEAPETDRFKPGDTAIWGARDAYTRVVKICLRLRNRAREVYHVTWEQDGDRYEASIPVEQLAPLPAAPPKSEPRPEPRFKVGDRVVLKAPKTATAGELIKGQVGTVERDVAGHVTCSFGRWGLWVMDAESLAYAPPEEAAEPSVGERLVAGAKEALAISRGKHTGPDRRPLLSITVPIPEGLSLDHIVRCETAVRDYAERNLSAAAELVYRPR